jgi:integrase
MNYTPSINTRMWNRVEVFVENAVARCSGKTAYSDADLYQSCSRLAAWAKPSKKDELTDAIFAPAFIEAFIAEGLPSYSAASRGNRRSILLRMSEEILGDRAARVRLEALPSSTPSAPYTTGEVARLRRWAERASEARRPQAQALIALALGCGLSTSEITEVRRGDVIQLGTQITVRVRSGRQRSVAMAGEWAAPIIAAIVGLDDADWVFCPERRGTGGKNMVTNFVAGDSRAGLKPNVQRMRATWIVSRLQGGAPAIQLMRDSGVRSMEALNRFARFVDAA